MRVPNITRGPICLSKIEYFPRLSEETIAFTAEITINGLRGTVQNEGHGGDNSISPPAVLDAVNAYAATLPAVEFGGHTLPQNYDSLIGEIVGDAVEAIEMQKERAKMAKKGFTHEVSVGTTIYYIRRQPTATDFQRMFGADAAKARVVPLTV